MTKRILLDVDGVLANFYEGALSVHGVDPDSMPPCEWDIAAAIGVSEEKFWEPLDNYNFWIGLDEYPWAAELVALLSEAESVHFCTSPSYSPDCYKAKVEWLRHHFGSDSRIMLGADKFLMASPNHILIDDNPGNIEAFKDAGGIGILFPAKWNGLGNVKDKIDYVLMKLAVIEVGLFSGNRNEYPIFKGLLDYFPNACAAVARHSFLSNEQHNPGEPMHWDDGKSVGTGDQIVRHLMEGHLEASAWRALELLERKLTSKPPFQ